MIKYSIPIDQESVGTFSFLYTPGLEPSQDYEIEIPPNSVTDIYGQGNDSLAYTISVKAPVEFSTLDLQMHSKQTSARNL